MTAREIVLTAMNEGLIESTGKTPDATLAGQLYTEMQRNRDRFLWRRPRPSRTTQQRLHGDYHCRSVRHGGPRRLRIELA